MFFLSIFQRNRKLSLIIFVYWLLITISWYFGTMRYRGMLFYFIFIIPQLTAFLISTNVNRKKIIVIIFISGAVLAIEGILQIINEPLFLSWTKSFPNRIFSFIGNPNPFGTFLGFLSILALLTRFKYKYLLFAALFSIILFTKSRGALISTILAFIIYLYRINRKAALASVLLFAIVIFLSHKRLWTASSKQRYYLYLSAMNMTLDKPLFGYGFFSFRDRLQYYVMPQFRSIFNDTEVGAKFPHNEYLNQLSNFGIIGASLFFLFIFIYARKNYYLPALSVVLIHNLFSYPLFYPSIALLFWFFLFSNIAEQSQSRALLPFSAIIVFILGFYFLPEYYRGSQQFKNNLRTGNKIYLENIFNIKHFFKKEVINKLGAASLRDENYEKALFYYKTNAEKFFPTPATYINIGTTYERSKHFYHALYFYRRVLNIRRDYDILSRIAQIYGYLGNRRSAENYFRLSFADNRFEPATYIKRAYFYIEQRKYAPAIKDLSFALLLKPANLNIIFKDLTFCYLKTGQFDVGIDKLSKYTASKNREIFYDLAALYEAKGEFGQRDFYLKKYNSAR